MTVRVHSAVGTIVLLLVVTLSGKMVHGAGVPDQAPVYPVPETGGQLASVRFQHIGENEGLMQKKILTIFQDRVGYIWMGTNEGLIRYNANQFQSFGYQFNDSTSLSNNQVLCLYEDTRGWLWAGTENGLNCFIPESESFFRVRTFTDGIGDATPNAVYSICEDSTGALWTGNNIGLSRIQFVGDPTGHSPQWLQQHPDQIRISHLLAETEKTGDYQNRIFAVLIDRRNNFWVGTELGLARLLPDKSRQTNAPENGSGSYRFDLIYQQITDAHDLLKTTILRLLQTEDGAIWAKTAMGLVRVDFPDAPDLPLGSRLKSTGYPYTDPRIPHYKQGAFIELPGETGSMLWMNLKDTGFSLFDPRDGVFLNLPGGNKPQDNSLIPYMIHTIFSDRSGIIWVGTETNGLFKYDVQANRFSDYNQKLDKIITNELIDMRFAYEDSHGDLWIGNEGVYRCDRATGKLLSAFGTNVSDLEWTFRNAIQEDGKGGLWIASEYGGLYYYDREQDQMTRPVCYRQNAQDTFRHTPELRGEKFDPRGRTLIIRADGDSLWVNENVTALASDRQGIIWAAVKVELTGNDANVQNRFYVIYRVDPFEQKTDRYPLKTPDKISQFDADFFIYAIEPESADRLWLGTGNGFMRLNPVTGALKVYQAEPRNPGTISNNRVHSIKADKLKPERYIWLGTDEGGLNRFDRESEIFQHYTEVDGLPGNIVSSILYDRRGNLWLGTNRGLSNVILDPESREVVRFRNFDRRDGIKDDDFSFFYGQNAYQNQAGTMFFSGAKGISVFHPDDIRYEPQPSPVILSGFYLNLRPVSFRDPGSPLTEPISEAKEIILPFQDNSFSFEFAALDFHAPEKTRFAYQLEGYQDEWIYPGNERRAVFTQVPPGDYTFRVRAAVGEGKWDEQGVSLYITVTPPWYRRWWAYFLYTAALLSALWLIRRSELHREQLKSRAKLQHLETERLKEVNQLKTQFFTNISHEFRTPLTLILGPVTQELEESAVDRTRQRMQMVQRNANRLMQLINQLLDISALEAKRMELRAAPGDIVAFIRGITMAFASWAGQKSISLVVFTKVEELELYFDRDLMEKVINNLLSNALKFTPHGGKVELSIFNPPVAPGNKEAGKVKITVTDTGVGIPPERLPHIFDRFSQVDASTTREYEGSGIGLTLVKELVELHCGTIEVTSRPYAGTTFTIFIPLGKAHFEPEQLMASVTVSRTVKQPLLLHDDYARTGESETESSELLNEDSTAESTAVQPLLLIVEDHIDFRSYLYQNLQNNYRLIEAADGKSGWEKAVERTPDLVISDVMMPHMDGYQLCEKLKTDPRTSHIPVILLTAKATQNDKLSGLNTGADDYLGKPFDSRELIARVRNLIEQRAGLQEYYQQRIMRKASGVRVTSMEEQFVRNAIEVVENHLHEEQFSVDELASKIGLSRSQLHRKIQALTGKSSSHFIRTIRLERAAELIIKGAGNITEITYMVGFSSQSYFTKCFVEQFGCSPTEYKANPGGKPRINTTPVPQQR
jgi:signal transduction histidine kinase/ligand-binding sensor domain-containing protein/DNA-binding response OmpR family regulator